MKIVVVSKTVKQSLQNFGYGFESYSPCQKIVYGSVAQLVEHKTFNFGVLSSNLSGATICNERVDDYDIYMSNLL